MKRRIAFKTKNNQINIAPIPDEVLSELRGLYERRDFNIGNTVSGIPA